ncbi:MAG TPA: DNA-3-methyladenine glycosylase I [Acidobacteriota bacterium]|nr:DNA-3-methyladenine glycosylase I [Acidobacteriota bacterium]
MKKITRCCWAPLDDPLYLEYHDQEWGKPVHDDRVLYEFLLLESFQAGLSWATILRKRENFRRAFHGFDPHQIARYDDSHVARLLQDAGIVRHRQKIESAINNARQLLDIQEQRGSFDSYIWEFVDGSPILNQFTTLAEIPSRTAISDRMSKDLKQRGFRFLGSTTCYSFMQACGLVNDHILACAYRHKPG